MPVEAGRRGWDHQEPQRRLTCTLDGRPPGNPTSSVYYIGKQPLPPSLALAKGSPICKRLQKKTSGGIEVFLCPGDALYRRKATGTFEKTGDWPNRMEDHQETKKSFLPECQGQGALVLVRERSTCLQLEPTSPNGTLPPKIGGGARTPSSAVPSTPPPPLRS